MIISAKYLMSSCKKVEKKFLKSCSSQFEYARFVWRFKVEKVFEEVSLDSVYENVFKLIG